MNSRKDLQLPCGKCMGCNEAKAKEWALRCTLEAQEHRHTAFTTLTYNKENLPVTLDVRHLQLFQKRLRKALARQTPARTIRTFACGEYGEKNGRPHYHALLFGVEESDKELIQKCWPNGHAYTVKANPASINYVAGYTAKKYGDLRRAQEERVDPDTGEVYQWKPPFLIMSRRPGIGAKAKVKYNDSWRKCAVLNGTTQAVPRYLHEGWRKNATAEQIEQLENEKEQKINEIKMTKAQREAAQLIAIAKQRLKAGKRKI